MARCHVADHDDVHRLLPPEILEDIGVVKADELQHLAVVEELAARLATVLGSTANVAQCHAVPPTRATASSYQHRRRPHPQVYGLQHVQQGGGFPGGSNAQMQMGQASPFPNSRRMPEHDLTLLLPRFAPAPARPPVVGTVVPHHEMAKHSSRGTGVFLPCSNGGHIHHATRQTVPPRTPQKCRRAAAATAVPGGGRQKDGHAAAVRQQRLHLHAQLAIAHAVAGAEMLEQQLHMMNTMATHARPLELARPHGWIH
ncbi:hypothetical protein C2845_PM02G26020 [Panicum miliaceum]|uniref:Uncharacterized protein n=1 Tax=Panicum miliaceum TaxID=4540 RepID=A0A3L6SD88_PANMI|nr:hypothetical protein C2845_PM02G26020 [Panicum miliaceum]